VARLQLQKLNAQLTELTEQQAAYIGVPVEGPGMKVKRLHDPTHPSIRSAKRRPALLKPALTGKAATKNSGLFF